MSAKNYYKVSYEYEDNQNNSADNTVLDNDLSLNANQFKLYDDFTTNLRISNHFPVTEFNGTDNGRKPSDANDSGVDMENGNLAEEVAGVNDTELLENEVMVDTWSSMDSTNSPLTDSGPSASEDCTPSTPSEPNRDFPSSSPAACNPQNDRKTQKPTITDKPRSRELALDLEALEPVQRKPHFLDEDYQPPNNLNIEYKIPKPHFLDTTPSPDDIDERSDITNPHFLDDDIDNNPVQSKTGALPKRSHNITTSATIEEPRPNFRGTIHYGVENAARACERDKRASQLYREAWPNDRDWTGHDSASIRSYSSNGSADISKSSKLENKMECVYSLLSLLTLSPDNNADLSGPLHEMSRSVESCIAMRQAGCIPLLVQLIHSKLPRETRDRAAKALRNIIHTQTDDKAGRREARVWRLLEQVREYCYSLEEVAEAKNDEKPIEDDATKHPSQSVAALMKLSFDEEHRHVVCQLGGLQALASLVSSDQAAHGSRTDDNTCLTMRKYAGMTLTNLTFGDGNNKSLLCSFKDFMMALVDQLESPNDDMRQVTAAVLRNLSWRADSNSKQVLREVGAVKGLTKAAMSCSKEATLKSVLSALWNLTAHCSMNKVALCSVDGALGFLVNMLNYDSPTKTLAIVENAGGIMRNVSSHIAVREDYRQILRERNCLGVLLQHLKSPSLTVVSNSCGTLWNLSARCPLDQQFLWDHGAVPLLRSLIHSKHKMIAMGSSAALKNLLNSKPGKCHIAALDSTARNMNLPVLPTLGVRKQKALEQELDQNLAETCDNIEPATSPSTSKREEKNLFNATEKQIAMNLDRHRMTSSSPMMGSLTSQVSLSHSAHLTGFLSCTNTLLKGASMVSRSSAGSSNQVNRSDSKDSVTSTHSDTVFEKVMRTGKVPIPTPRNRDLVKTAENSADRFKKATTKDGTFRFPVQPPIPPPRSSTELRTNYTESGYDLDQDSCDQPIDFSQKYSETKSNGALEEKPKPDTKKPSKKDSSSFGDYQETDLDQPTDYSIRYAEHHSESASDSSEPPVPSVNEDTIQHFATEGTPYETPITFSTSTSMSDLRIIGKEGKLKISAQLKENPELMTHSDEKDTCSIEEPNLPLSNENADEVKSVAQDKRAVFDTKFSSGLITPDEPVNYCDEGTPGYFSRVSSLSSLGEATEEECLAKRNAIATINVDPAEDFQVSSSVKDKESSKAVTFASEPVAFSSSAATPGTSSPPNASSRTSPPGASSANCEGDLMVDDTPLMFSRTSSLGSLPDCGQPDDQGSLHSSISRMTSGCISPSEIPDSPPGGNSPRLQLCRPPHTHQQEVEQEPIGERSVFDERARTFVVENTPAHFSTATSLSSLTIDDEHDRKCNQSNVEQPIADEPVRVRSVFDERVQTFVVENTPAHFSTATSLSSLNIDDEQERKCGPSNMEQAKGPEQPHSVFDERARTFVVENTPAHFSTATSLSSLNIDDDDRKANSEQTADASQADFTNNYRSPSNYYQRNQLNRSVQDENSKEAASISGACVDTDSSNLSDNSDLLNECIQKGIDTVLNKGPSSESGSISYGHRHGPYNSLPPYLRSSTETVKMSHDYVNVRSIIGSSPPPPLPPRHAHVTAPPPPPRQSHATVTERKHESRLPIKTQSSRDHRNKPSLPIANHLSKTDSLSSIDSFGSTDQEIFEQTVNAGVNRARFVQDKVKAHSVERPQEVTKQHRFHKSLDRSDRIKDKVLSSSKHSQMRRLEAEFSGLSMTRSPYSYHGETSNSTLSHNARSRHSRYHDEGPPSLPIRIERSSSLSSLSNESFGSTDREVFERCVKMGMSKPQGQVKKGDLNIKARVRSDDRLEYREHRRRSRKDRPAPNALDRMVGDEYAKDRAILEEVIARGAGDNKAQSKNASCRAGGSATVARDNSPGTNFDDDSAIHTSDDTCCHDTSDLDPLNKSNEMPTVDSGNTTFESVENEMDHSNEFLAPTSVNTTLNSEGKDELNRSNESYAEMLDHSWSDSSPPKDCDVATLTRKKKTWTDIKTTEKQTEVEIGPKNLDTWNDNTCPDDVTFPTLSGSIHLVSSIKSEVLDYPHMLPDLLEKSGVSMFTRPDLTNKLERTSPESNAARTNSLEFRGIGDIPEPSFTSIVEDADHKYDSLMSTEIAREAARLAAQLKNSQYTMETSISSLASLDLDNVNPPSNLGSLLSLTNSANFDETSSSSKKLQKPRKKSMPISIMAKRALSNSMHQGSPDSQPLSFIENVKPPSEMEHLDMESSMLSVCSIVSETADGKEKPSIVFDFKQPVTEFPMRSNLTVFDLDKVNPPSLFDEMTESTFEMEQTTANLYEDCTSTLNVVTDIPSGSENCTPIPSDYSSVETTPKRQRALKYLTPKEKRLVAKDRYQTYTITDTVTENDVTVAPDSENYLTWTKSESDRSDDYVTANSEIKSKRRMSAKQRRLEDRARYQTQTVDLSSVLNQNLPEVNATDPNIENLKQRLAAKRTIKQRRLEDAERFRTRTLSEDIPPSPTFVSKDANFENVETTTGYDSLSSNELNHQQIADDRSDDVFSRDADSGHNEDDIELNSTQLKTFTRSFKNYLPVTESPSAVDLCVFNNLKNIEISSSYTKTVENDAKNPNSGDFASYAGDLDDKTHSDSDSELPPSRPKPKITKPSPKRDESLDSNDSREQDGPKAIRGRKKAAYVSPYRNSFPVTKKLTPTTPKQVNKTGSISKAPSSSNTRNPPKTVNKAVTPKSSSVNTSPKKTLKSPYQFTQKLGVTTPLSALRLPLERQGTFTKEDSSVQAKSLPNTDKAQSAKCNPTLANPNTSPSRLPLSKYSRPMLRKANSNDKPSTSKSPYRASAPTMRNSASNHSLQSNDSSKTVTLSSKNSRPGSTSSVNSAASKAKDVESRIAGLWKKVEQAKKQPVNTKPDKRVWIEPSKAETPRLIRSSTFDGQPQETVTAPPKQKTEIGIKVSQIPSLKPKTQVQKMVATNVATTSSRKVIQTRVFVKKSVNGQGLT